MPRFEAVIFDMDGVIVDSEPRHERAFLQVFEEIGFSENHGINFPDYYGKSDQTVWDDFIKKHRPSHSLEDLTNRKHGRFIEMIEEEKPVFPGLTDLLEKLASDYKLAIASGSSHPIIDGILNLDGLRRFFPVVVSSQDVAQGKPAPDIFLRTAGHLNVEPKNCCVIEDSAAGVEGALAAGMTVIAITNSLPREKLQHATHVVRTYDEIERLLN